MQPLIHILQFRWWLVYLVLIGLLLLCNGFFCAAHALTPAEIRQRAVVMVDGPAGRDTAVCIYGRGVFVTSARSVGNQTKVRLLAPWLADEKNAFDLLVWRVDKQRDLAVLVPEKPFPANFASLSPGDANALKVKAPVTFFGFSTESKTNSGNSAMPQVETASASVVSLPQTNDNVPLIRVLAAAPKIKSGGPLIDETGRLVGLMRTVEIKGDKPSTAIPINTIFAAMMPKITLKAAPTNSGKSGAPQQVFINLETAEQHGGRIPGDLGVYNEMDARPLYSIDLAVGDGKNWRVSSVSRVQAREFVATDIRITAEKKPLFYKISVRRDDVAIGTITGLFNLLPVKTPSTVKVSSVIPLVPVPMVPEEKVKLTFLPPTLNSANGHFYQIALSSQPVAWEDAKNLAAAQKWITGNGHLATITDAKEQAFIQQYIVRQLPDRTTGYWLGSFQEKNAVEPAGGWRWITGETWQYTSWWPGEPNQLKGDKEDFLELLPQGGWNDTTGSHAAHRGFLIEFEVPVANKPPEPSSPKLPTGQPPEITAPSGDGIAAPRLNPVNGHYYQMFSAPLTWYAAQNAAATRTFSKVAGHLATISTQSEQDFLANLTREQEAWTGGIQAPGSAEPGGGFSWITGEPLAFTNWRGGEPNNAPPSNEDRILLTHDGTWNDMSATETVAHYLVEFDVAPGAVPTVGATEQTLGDKTLVNLPGQVTDVTVGGAGRYIALYFQALRKIAIFDATQGKIVRYLSVGADEAYIAAGMDKLVVILPNEGIIQRWNLLTGERELSTLLPGGFIAVGAGMGASSQGPVGIAQQTRWRGPDSGGPIVFFDLQKLQPLDVKIIPNGVNPRGIEGKNVRVSADGTLFTAWVNEGSPREGGITVLNGSVLSRRVGVADVGLVLPSPDGRTIYTSVGLFTPDMKPLDGRENERRNEEIAFLPSYSSAFYLGLNGVNRFWGRAGGFGQQKPSPVELSLYSANDRRLIMKLATLEEVGDPMAGVRSSDRLPADKRIFFMPSYNLLVTLSAARDQLVLRPIELLRELQKLDVDYLFVQSVPPNVAVKGRHYTYQLDVVARHAVTFKLDSGPPGMAITEKGRLTWMPPANYTGTEEVVILSIHDTLGQEIFHTFRIKVEDAP